MTTDAAATRTSLIYRREAMSITGAATVTRNNNTETELELNETRYGIQADFGAAGVRYRSFARISFERTS